MERLGCRSRTRMMRRLKITLPPFAGNPRRLFGHLTRSALHSKGAASLATLDPFRKSTPPRLVAPSKRRRLPARELEKHE